MADDPLIRPASSLNAWVSGLAAGAVMIVIGILAAPPPANEFAIPRATIQPLFVLLAAGAAAAVPPRRLRASMGLTLVLAVTAIGFTWFIGLWVNHWMTVSAAVRPKVDWPAIMWRRDLFHSLIAVLPWCSLGTYFGKA